MAAKVLTDRAIRAFKAADKGKRALHMDVVVPSFGVRVTDSGKRTYVLVKRFPGDRHPTPRAIAAVGEITLEQARARARLWLEQIQKGVDPALAAAEQRREAERQQAGTFAAVFEVFVQRHLSTLR